MIVSCSVVSDAQPRPSGWSLHLLNEAPRARFLVWLMMGSCSLRWTSVVSVLSGRRQSAVTSERASGSDPMRGPLRAWQCAVLGNGCSNFCSCQLSPLFPTSAPMTKGGEQTEICPMPPKVAPATFQDQVLCSCHFPTTLRSRSESVAELAVSTPSVRHPASSHNTRAATDHVI